MRLTLFCQHSTLIQHLETELEYFKAQFEHERQRAEIAIQELIAVRTGVPVQLQQLTPREISRQQAAIEKILSDPEFTTSGDAGAE